MIYIIIGVVIICIFYYINMNFITVTKYTIKSKKINNNKRIVQISDLHNKKFGKNNKRLMKKIDNLKPDIIVLTGDIIQKSNNKYEDSFKFINKLSNKYKVIAVLGNHEIEHKNSKSVINKINNTGVILLENNSNSMDEIIFYGITYNNKLSYKENSDEKIYELLKKNFNNLNKEKFNIFLAHNPLIFDVYDKLGFDITLSGHVHGGIIRFFNIGLLSPERKFFPRYSGGLYKGKNSKLIVNRGLGDSSVKFRLFNFPEITCIDLKK